MIYRSFSKRQLLAMSWWNKPNLSQFEGIICDGAVRSGKTMALTVGFFLWSMATFNGAVLGLCGKTIGALRRNVVIRLPQWLGGLFQISQQVSENKLVITDGQGHSNTYYLFGGQDESAAQLIQGITLAGILMDEAALLPRSFLEQACARCSEPGSRLWMSCNPEGQEHWFYQEWIQKAGASGLLMGMGDAATGLSHAVTGTVKESYGNYKQQKAIADVTAADQMAVEQLQAQAQMAVDNKFGNVNKVEKKSAKVEEKASSRNVRQLYKAVEKSFNAADQAQINNALVEAGIDGKTAKQLAKAIAMDSRGERLTDAQNEMLFEYGDNEAVQKVVNQLVVNSGSSINQRRTALRSIANESVLRQEFEKAGFSKEASDIFAKVFVADQNNRQLTKEEQDILESIEQDPTVQRAIQAAQEAESTENFTTAKQVFDNVKQTYSGVNNVIADVSDVDRSAMLQVYDQESNGNEVRFAGAMLAAYSYGYENQDIGKTSKLQDSVLLQSLTEPQRMFAWKLGRDAAIADANKRKDQLNTTYKKAQEANQAAKKEPARYGAVQDQSMIGTQLKGERLASYKLADKIAKAVKTIVVAYRGGTEWGYYDHSTDRIYINVDAKWSEKTMILFTLGHELVHRAKAGSPTQYQAFADFLIAEYGKRGADVDAMIAQQIEAADGNMTRDQAFDEVVADACQRMLLDTNAGKKLAKWGAQSQQNKNIVQKVVQWIKDLFAKLRSYYTNVDPDSLAAREFMKLDKQVQKQLADMFVEMSMEAGEKLSTIQEAGMGEKNTAREDGRQFKLGVMTRAEIQAVQNIGRVSVNSFSSADIKATERLAQEYWKKMGVNSPFFRAWFGDWRVSDQKPIQISKKKGDTRTDHRNKDTGWAIRNSGKVHDETKTHRSVKNREAVPYLPYIDEIIENAVLLDTGGLGKNKSENSLLMHYLYAVADIGYGPVVLKLTVEEMYNPNTQDSGMRAYALHNIEKAFAVRGRVQGNSPSSGTNTTNAVRTVADLFAAVKRMDADFNPNPVSKIVNADGTPKIMYHGSPAQFTIFDKKKAKSSGQYGRGFYFTDSQSHAGQYGQQYSVYLNIRNPLQYGGETVSRSQVQKFLEAVAENEDYSIENYGTYDVDSVLQTIMGNAADIDAFQLIQDVNATAIGDMVEAAELFNKVNGTKYDGIVAATEMVAFYPEQIKSATDNIGTFNGNNPDILYKRPVKDSVGRDLSEGQQEYFAQSQARNFNGSLASLYHGTENGGFTQFDPQKSDDKTTIFLTDNIRMAATYSGSTELIQLAKGKPKLLRWMDGDTTQGKGQRGVYNVYANIKKPLIVDAKGENWNNLSSKAGYNAVNFDVEVNDYGDVDWNNTSIRLTTKANGKSQSQTFRSVDALNQYLTQRYDSSIAGRVSLVAFRSVDTANTVSVQWNEQTKTEVWKEKTRQIAEKAKNQGYDGVIIRNVFDSGKYGKRAADEKGTVYIVFESNQIKDVNNKKPTDDPDIRYKMPVTQKTQKQLEAAKERVGRYMDEVRGLKKDVKIMEQEFARIARVFETQARRSGKKDVQIADLRQALKAEAKKHRADQRVWEAEFDRLMKEYDRSGRKIEQLEDKIQHQRQAAKDKVESRKATEVRHKIIRFKEKLQSTLQHATENKYIPVNLIQAMVDVCELIDDSTELYKKDGSLNQAQVAREQTMQRLIELKAQVAKIAKDESYTDDIDDFVVEQLDVLLQKFSGRSLRDMTRSELEEMYGILKGIDEAVRDARKLIGFGEIEDAYAAADVVFAEQAKITKKRKNGKRSVIGKANDARIDYTLSPVRNVERMSGWNQNAMLVKLFRELEKGVHKKDMFRMLAYKMFEALSSGKEYQDALYKPYGNQITDIHGRKFQVSKMQMMQAILSFEREVANGHLHIQKGGLKFADLDLLKKGKINDSVQAENAHRVMGAANLVDAFAQELKDDKWCQEYMAMARKFFNETAKDAINETTVKWKHRMVATEKSYIPYEVDKDFVHQEISAENNIQKTINGYGILQQMQDKAPQAIVITGLNNIIEKHIDNVSTMYGLAIPIRDFNKVWNMRSLDQSTTVKETIGANWGESGVKHITQAIQDLQGRRVGNESGAYKNLKSKYVGAKFMLNPSIVMKQMGSLYSARAMLKSGSMAGSVGNLLYTMTHHKAIAEEVNQYTASAWVRRQGVSDAELSSLLTETQRSLIGKAAQKLPAYANPAKWIATMDYMVALSLWKYAKMDVARRTGLEGEELLKATAEYYDQVIDNTQSMSDVLHRPEVQKAGNMFSDMFGMFKTDLYQMAGQLQMTAGRFMADRTAENFKALAKTVAGTMASAIWGNLMTVFFAALFYKMNPFRDDDEEVTWESVMKRTAFSFGGDVLSYFAPMFGGDLVDIFEQIYYGESGNNLESIPLSVLNNMIGTIQDVAKSVGEGKEIGASTFKKLITQGLEFFGVPAGNAFKIFDAIKLHAEDIANGEPLSFEAGANRSDSLSYYLDIVNGKTEQAEKQYSEMLEEKIADGYLKHEAEDAIRSELATQIGKHYMEGTIDREDALEMLETYADRGEDEIKKWDFEMEYGFSWGQRVRQYRLGNITEDELAEAVMDIEGVDREAADAYIDFLDLEKQYPDISITAADAEGYYKYAEPANIKPEVYMDYKAKASQCKGEKDKNGNTISGSVKEQIMDLIDSLQLTKAQKDALYRANGWAESGIRNAPWH